MTSTLTASGSSTSDLATYSTSSAAAIVVLLLSGGHDAGRAEEAEDGIRWLGALGLPGGRLLGVDVELDRLGSRVVVADDLDRPTVAGGAAVGDDDAVGRLFRRAHARQPDSDCHLGLVPPWYTVRRWGPTDQTMVERRLSAP